MKLFTITFSVLIFTCGLTFAQNHTNNKAYLGVYANAISEKKAKKLKFEQTTGSYITHVLENTAADRAGLKPFDFVYQIDEKTFGSHESLSQLLRNYQVGDQVPVYFIRDGKKQVRQVTLGTKSDPNTTRRSDSEDPFLGVSANHTDNPEGVDGVRVDIVENSTAEKMGLQDDDIIVRVNNYTVLDWHDLGAAIDVNEVGDKIKVAYIRGDKTTVAYAPIQSLAATKGTTTQHGSYSYSYSYGNNSDTKAEKVPATEEAPVTPVESPMEIEMDEVPQADVDQMKEELGIVMPVVQNLQIERLKIFPNPTVGLFNLTFDLPNNGNTTIQIFNNLGKLVFQNELGQFSGSYQEQIDLGLQPAGVYYVMIQQEDYTITKKVIVKKM